MRKKGTIYFLLFVSILMLAVPLVPHHHHADGAICLRNDIAHTVTCGDQHVNCTDPHHRCNDVSHCCTNNAHSDSNAQQQHQPDNDVCCHDNCLTRFYTSAPTAQIDLSHLQYDFVAVLFTDYLIENILTPDEQRIKNYYVYRESLHGTGVTRAFSLRGPPSLWA